MGVLLEKTPHIKIINPCCKGLYLISVAPHFRVFFGFSKIRLIISMGYKISSHFAVEEKLGIVPVGFFTTCEKALPLNHGRMVRFLDTSFLYIIMVIKNNKGKNIGRFSEDSASHQSQKKPVGDP
jgi:hypothetical protein